MSEWEDILALVRQPARYLAGELNAANKDFDRADLRVVMAFPDLYEMGMSHLGIRIIYHLLNDLEGVACDRVYAPWVDMEEILVKKDIPLLSHEAQKPIKDFDLLGFSLPHEMCNTNVLNMLKLAGMPLYSRDRKDGKWPLVLGGGPAASNPEPLADFFDAFLFGEGEEAVVEIAHAMKDWKKSGRSKEALLESLAGIEGVYVPDFFEPEYKDDGAFAGIRPLKPGMDTVRRRIVADLESAFFPTAPLLPVIEAVHDRVMVEAARGCARGCRFCQAGMIYRPYRERTPEKVMGLMRKGLQATGHEECSILSLSAGDYSGIEALLIRLMHENYSKRVAISLPSLRVNSLGDRLMEAIKKVRKTGFTIAPEAATERLRRIINKPFTDDELFETADRLFAQGWRTLKLYFMIGLPGETEEDRDAIPPLAAKIEEIGRRRGSKFQINVSVSAFVPKPHTPFQWDRQISAEEQADILGRMKKGLRGQRLKMKWQDSRLSELEGIFSRGDRRLAGLLEAAHKRGLRFEGWSEQFDPGQWREAYRDAGVNPESYMRERDEAEALPWDHMDSRIKREYLLKERKRAREEAFTMECREKYKDEKGCSQFCGVCGGNIEPLTVKPMEVSPDLVEEFKKPDGQPDIFFRYRVRYRRFGPARFFGHLEINRSLTRAMRRAALPLRYSQGFHPLPKMTFGPAPPVGVESEAEFFEMELLEHWSVERVREALETSMPPGIEVAGIKEVSLKSPAITAMINSFEYEIESPEGGALFNAEKIDEFLKRDACRIVQKREKGDRTIDLKPLVKFIKLDDDGALQMGIRVLQGPGVKPQEVAAAVFGLEDDDVKKLRIIRTAAKFKAASAVRYPGEAARTRRVKRAGR